MRDEAIDAVRGVCIFSMVIGHICFESTMWRIVHPTPWIDGASGFVLVSGLVLGMVSRRRVDTLVEMRVASAATYENDGADSVNSTLARHSYPSPPQRRSLTTRTRVPVDEPHP